MIQEKLEELFTIARSLYELKQHDSGMVEPMPFAYAFRDGELLVFSRFGKHSAALAAALGIELPEQHPNVKVLGITTEESPSPAS